MEYPIMIILGMLVVMFAKPNAAGPGCEWSGCQHLTGSKCSTGVTGASGRPIWHKSQKCEMFGRKDYCCDDDCGYQQCGKPCGDLRMTSWPEIQTRSCTINIPGWGNFNGVEEFCCP